MKIQQLSSSHQRTCKSGHALNAAESLRGHAKSPKLMRRVGAAISEDDDHDVVPAEEDEDKVATDEANEDDDDGKGAAAVNDDADDDEERTEETEREGRLGGNKQERE